MQEVEINLWAVVAATAVSMVVGSLWYSKALFGTLWMKLVGMTPEKAKVGAVPAMVSMLVGAFIQQYVLAHVIKFSEAVTFWDGVAGGIWMWLGFIAVVTMADVTFAKRPYQLWLITNSYQFVIMVTGAVILTLWV